MTKVLSYPDWLWDEVVLTANYLQKGMLSMFGNVPGKTPSQAFMENRTDLYVLHLFGAK